jgi:hypothetical protein
MDGEAGSNIMIDTLDDPVCTEGDMKEMAVPKTKLPNGN